MKSVLRTVPVDVLVEVPGVGLVATFDLDDFFAFLPFGYFFRILRLCIILVALLLLLLMLAR